MDELVTVAAPVQAAANVQATDAKPTTAAATPKDATAVNATTPPATRAAVTVPAATTSAPVVDAPHKVAFPLRTTTTAQVAHPATHSSTDAGSIGGAVFSLLLVIGLILGLGWLAKRMPGMNRGTQSSQLKVVASVALGPRERAVVLDVGGQQLLVGVGQGGVRTLHTLEHPLPVAESTAPSVFAQVLAQHFGKKS
ncbi:flagellar biosynthetic protein FliO [Lysobacter sp. TY2-98]|nr:flagellar biosynthetic protein FliO [Lysobacter sp. TY2-98]AXK71208.1 flagellar biosynthetic protein FliO [Lysobacter sp. TY2-98]